MHPQVSTATVALAVAVMAAGMPDVVDARPMHAAIESKYHRYLEEKEAISAELDAWLNVYGPKGPKNGWIPVTESRSLDDELEDQRQRFYLSKEQIYEARAANPMAEFGTEGPFTLMTMDEFTSFLSNSHVGGDDKTDASSPTTQTLSDNSPAKEESNVVSSSSKNDKKEKDDDDDDTPGPNIVYSSSNKKKNDDDDDDEDKDKNKDKKTWAPATEGPLVIAAMRRRLRTSGKSEYAYNGGYYSANTDTGYQSTSATQTSQQTPQSTTSNNGNNGGNTNGGYNFNIVSEGDSTQVGTVSRGSNGETNTQSWKWLGNNGWGNSWWSSNNKLSGNWGAGGSAAGSSNSQQWTQPSGSSNSQQWTQPPKWTPPSGSSNSQQWTQPPSLPATQPPAPPATEAPVTALPYTPAPTDAPVTAPPAPPTTEAPTKAPPVTPAPAPVTKAPATATPAPKKKSTTAAKTVIDTKTASDADSDSVDWSTSPCVNPPGLQGQCGSCWAFATVGALEAAQCIANGDKKAPTYSEQQLVSCDTQDFGCNGGAPVYAMEYVRDNGICTESSYPYSSVEGGTAAACSNSCTPTKSGITEIVQLTTGDESALLSVLKQQPVIVSVVSNNSAWKQYVSGVITACDATTVDHAVLAVGFDASTIKIKNSWGTDWGEDGYVHISRSTQNKGTCAILTDMSYPKL